MCAQGDHQTQRTLPIRVSHAMSQARTLGPGSSARIADLARVWNRASRRATMRPLLGMSARIGSTFEGPRTPRSDRGGEIPERPVDRRSGRATVGSDNLGTRRVHMTSQFQCDERGSCPRHVPEALSNIVRVALAYAREQTTRVRPRDVVLSTGLLASGHSAPFCASPAGCGTRTCASGPVLSLPSKADRRSASAAPFRCSERTSRDSYFSIITSRPLPSCSLLRE